MVSEFPILAQGIPYWVQEDRNAEPGSPVIGSKAPKDPNIAPGSLHSDTSHTYDSGNLSYGTACPTYGSENLSYGTSSP